MGEPDKTSPAAPKPPPPPRVYTARGVARARVQGGREGGRGRRERARGEGEPGGDEREIEASRRKRERERGEWDGGTIWVIEGGPTPGGGQGPSFYYPGSRRGSQPLRHIALSLSRGPCVLSMFMRKLTLGSGLNGWTRNAPLLMNRFCPPCIRV